MQYISDQNWQYIYFLRLQIPEGTLNLADLQRDNPALHSKKFLYFFVSRFHS
jgi:hypothetical protein